MANRPNWNNFKSLQLWKRVRLSFQNFQKWNLQTQVNSLNCSECLRKNFINKFAPLFSECERGKSSQFVAEANINLITKADTEFLKKGGQGSRLCGKHLPALHKTPALETALTNINPSQIWENANKWHVSVNKNYLPWRNEAYVTVWPCTVPSACRGV